VCRSLHDNWSGDWPRNSDCTPLELFSLNRTLQPYDIMRERIHSYLDGELPLEMLSSSERAELREMEDAIEAATMSLTSAPVPDFAARVMNALPERRASWRESISGALTSAATWIWAPRQVALRPAYIFGSAFAVLLVVLSLQPFSGGAMIGSAGGVTVEEQQLFVQFRLDAENVSTVAIAGSFTDWEPSQELREVAPGVWTVLVALRPGVHDYLFVVDGEEWIPDPVARPVDDGFGGTNSRLFLTVPAVST